MNEQEKKSIAEAQDFRDVFTSLPGQRVLERLKVFCHDEHSTISDANGAVDPFRSILREGERNVILFINSRIRAADVDIKRPARAETENDNTE